MLCKLEPRAFPTRFVRGLVHRLIVHESETTVALSVHFPPAVFTHGHFRIRHDNFPSRASFGSPFAAAPH